MNESIRNYSDKVNFVDCTQDSDVGSSTSLGKTTIYSVGVDNFKTIKAFNTDYIELSQTLNLEGEKKRFYIKISDFEKATGETVPPVPGRITDLAKQIFSEKPVHQATEDPKEKLTSSLCKSFKTGVTIETREELQQLLDSLKEKNQNKIDTLYLSATYFSNEDLKLLDAFEVNRLVISNNDRITEINTTASSLFFENCRNLKEIHASKAQSLFVLGCSNLERLDAPEAEMVKIKRSKIKELSCDKAKELTLLHCRDLEILKAPVVEMAEIVNCGIKELSLHKLKKLLVSYCLSLKSFDAPKLERAEIKNCGIKELSLTNLKELSVSSCLGLESINASDIKNLEIKSCGIRNLSLSGVKELNVSDCIRLESLKAPDLEALHIESSGIEELSLPNVKKLTVSNCPNLKSVHAPKLETSEPDKTT